MSQILFYSPGQLVTLVTETFDTNGVRADGYVDGYIDLDGYMDGYIDSYHHPMVARLVLPDFSEDADYPAHMTKLDTGLYYYQFTLPKGATAVGSYLADISYTDPVTLYTKTLLYQILVTAPYGIFSASPG